MKIISSVTPATTSQTSAPLPETPTLSIIPAVDPALSEEVKKMRDQLQAVQKDLQQWKQQGQEESARQIALTTKALTQLSERLNALEQLSRFSEAPAAAPVPAPQDSWDSDLRRKEKNLQDLKAELVKIPAASVSVPVPVPAAVPAPPKNQPVISEPSASLNIEGLKKQLAQESTYGTSSRTHSIFAKLWLYLNESAIEIPLKNSKNNS